MGHVIAVIATAIVWLAGGLLILGIVWAVGAIFWLPVMMVTGSFWAAQFIFFLVLGVLLAAAMS